MFETMNRLEHKDDSRFTLVPAFSGWLATKTRKNDARKALLLGATEQLPSSIDGGLHGPHRAVIVVVDDEPHLAITLSEILERLGYRAVWFTEPVAPMALMQVNSPMLESFDLAICLKRAHPDCRVLVTSVLGNDPEFVERIATAGVLVVLEAKHTQICQFLGRIAELILAGT